ncbi:hypothetical protein M885DRAFT_534362 [Pelagophyceae sp. CCMP2097]|nr:hypothetical protein M885DRAFT_534362 [Pelagophyceae sp. CCMP2097]
MMRARKSAKELPLYGSHDGGNGHKRRPCARNRCLKVLAAGLLVAVVFVLAGRSKQPAPAPAPPAPPAPPVDAAAEYEQQREVARERARQARQRGAAHAARHDVAHPTHLEAANAPRPALPDLVGAAAVATDLVPAKPATVSRIVIAVMPSAVDGSDDARRERIETICSTWGAAMKQYRNMKLVFAWDSMEAFHDELIGCGMFVNVPTRYQDTADSKYWWTMTEVHQMYNHPAWIFVVTDLTFVIPENLRCFLRNYDADEAHLLGNRARDTANGATFLLGTAGYAVSRGAVMPLLKQRHERICSPSSAREEKNPSLSVSKCYQDVLGRKLEDTRAGTAERFNVYPPLRLVADQHDDWYRDVHRKLGVSAPEPGLGAVPKDVISFHYTWGPEQYTIDTLLRHRENYRGLDDEQRTELWPKKHELRAYSFPPENQEQRDLLWRLLLDHIEVGACQDKDRHPAVVLTR